MFDPQRRPPPFSLHRRDMMLARQGRGLSRVEWRMAIFMPILLLVIGWTVWDWRERMADAMARGAEVLPIEQRLAPMAKPLWDALSALPDAAAIAVEREHAQALVAADASVPLTAQGLDALTLAWAEARLDADRQAPPLPQRLRARDLLLPDHVRLGAPLIIEGRIEDRLPGRSADSTRAWQRLLLAIDEGQFVEVLSDAPAAAELPIGSSVQVTGRLLAYERRPAEGGQEVELPVILGRVLVASAGAEPSEDLAEFHRPFVMPENILQDVDDFRLWTETRPYYYLLGQVLRDLSTPGVYEQVPDGNQAADDIHLRPHEHRGKPYRVTGYVYEGWEDRDVARDRPFGVGRVVRLLLWRRDIAPVTETINGVERRSIKQVLRLYEFAAITDQPIPPRGTLVVAEGRFFKKRAIPVKPDPERDRRNNVQRQSDRVYPWFFVTGPWRIVEPAKTYEVGPLGWAVTVVAGGLLIAGIWWWRREVSERGRQRRWLRRQAAAQAPSPAPPPPHTAERCPSSPPP
ncbi:MAG: hypothetical protein RMM29_04765 [Planctomycetota bacterium]|nr:hypothetical protein [Planctomycetota bacterium]